MTVLEFTFQWKIRFVDFSQNSKFKLSSSDFKCVHKNFGYTWNMIFFVYPSLTKNDEYKRMLILFYKDGCNAMIKCAYKLELAEFESATNSKCSSDRPSIYIQGYEMSKQYYCTNTREFTQGKEELWAEFSWLSLPSKIIREDIKKFLIDEEFVIIKCSICFDVNDFQIRDQNSIIAKQSEDRLGRKLFEAGFDLMSDENHSDIMLVSKDEKMFRCHKNILWAKCPSFEGFCKSQTDENFVLLNFDSGTVNEFLRYIYSNEIDETFLRNVALDLVSVAKKFHLNDLTKLCEISMLESIRKTNCLRYLLAADRHDLKQLKAKSISMIVTNFKEVKNDSDEWRNLMSEAPHLILSILEDAVARANVSVQFFF